MTQKKIQQVFVATLTCFASITACIPRAYNNVSGATSTNSADGCKKVTDYADKCPAKETLKFATENNIAYESYRINFHVEHGLPTNTFSLSFEFPNLSEANFNKLMQRYGGKNYVKWSPSRTAPYELTDFLPPKMQALLYRTLKQEYISFPPNELPPPDYWVWKSGPRQEYETGMACWDAAYEVIRDLGSNVSEQTAMTGHIGAPIVDAVLRNPKYFVSKETLARDSFLPHTPSAARSKGRQVGDLFLISNQANMGNGAAHAMVWIDDDLFFEKPDMGTGDPFRIVTWSMGAGPWLGNPNQLDSQNYSPETENVIVYRYKQLPKIWSFAGKSFFYDFAKDQETTQIAPLPAQIAKKYIFNRDVTMGGGLSTQRINPITEVKLVPDTLGRATYENADALGFIRLY